MNGPAMETTTPNQTRALLAALSLLVAAAAPVSGQTKTPAAPAPAEPPGPLKCVVCEKSGIVGTIRRHKFGLVCEECFKLELLCAACGLPMKEAFGKSTDGRVFCKHDFPFLVFKQDEAQKVYDETVLDLKRLLGGVMDLRFTNVNVEMFNTDYWNHREGKALPKQMRRGGFSHTTVAGREMKHNILLLSGVPRGDLASICAHEHTHLWLNENLPDTRAMEQNTLEAICELVAFKLASARKDEDQQLRIRRNDYTSGRIGKLIEAEQRHTIFAILEWARRGTTELADDAALASFSSKTPPRPPSSPTAGPAKTAGTAAQPVGARVPAAPTLQLVGLFLNPKKRAAQVNEQLFEAGDVKRLLLGEKVVVVKCIEVRTNAVVLSLDGSTNHVTLWHVGR